MTLDDEVGGGEGGGGGSRNLFHFVTVISNVVTFSFFQEFLFSILALCKYEYVAMTEEEDEVTT